MDNEGGDHGESWNDIAKDIVSIPTTSPTIQPRFVQFEVRIIYGICLSSPYIIAKVSLDRIGEFLQEVRQYRKDCREKADHHSFEDRALR